MLTKDIIQNIENILNKEEYEDGTKKFKTYSRQKYFDVDILVTDSFPSGIYFHIDLDTFHYRKSAEISFGRDPPEFEDSTIYRTCYQEIENLLKNAGFEVKRILGRGKWYEMLEVER